MATGPVYDYIVCGAGTAGCLLANRLSADKNKHVLLIEAGGNDDYLWVHIPVGYLYCIGNARTDWLYSTEADPGLNGRSLRYPRGKVLGGSSSINGMIYMRGQARDYDGWASGDGFGANPGWGWADCLPYFLKHEDFHRGADPFHAAPGFDPTGERPGGEWRVEKQRLRWDVLDAFAAAAQQAGIPPTADFNRGDNEGVGYFEVNQRSGVRWNAAKAFLRPIQRRGNLQVWTGAHITRLLFEQRGEGFANGVVRVAGVEVLPAGKGSAPVQATLASGGEVLLATGAIGTPQILQLSGIGPGDLLQQHGIAPVHDARRRRRQPAGSPADPRGLRGRRREDAEHDGRVVVRQGADRARVRGAPQRPDEHGAVAARRLHAQRPGAPASEPRIPRPAAVARCVRRAAAPLQRVHGQRLQPEPDQPRPGLDPLGRPGCGAADRAAATSAPRPTATSPRPACG